MRLKTKQRIDRTLGKWICSALTLFDKAFFRRKRLARTPLTQVKNILVIKFWGIGSIILASSGVRQIKQRHPDAHIMFLTLLGNRGIVEALSFCDEAIYLDIDCGILQLLRNTMQLLSVLKARKIDVVVDLEFFTCFSALITYFTSAPATGGFYDSLVWRGMLHTIEVPFNHYWHTKKNFENLISRCIDGPIEDRPAVRPNVAPSEAQQLRELLARNGIGCNAPLVCLNVNAGELSLERRWPANSFAKLGEQMARLYPSHKLVFIGSKAECDYVSNVCTAIGAGSILNLAGQLSLGMLIELLAAAKLLITNDSGPLHLAVALDVPTLSFFGPETPILYGPPQNGKHVVLYRNIDCSPCINVYNGKYMRCVRNGRDCLASITPDEALQRIQTMGILAKT